MSNNAQTNALIMNGLRRAIQRLEWQMALSPDDPALLKLKADLLRRLVEWQSKGESMDTLDKMF